MEPDSKSRIVSLPVESDQESVMAGMRPFGLISRNHGSFWVSLVISIGTVLYGYTPVSQSPESLLGHDISRDVF